MCCSIRAAVFFLASVHIYFAVNQMIKILPLVVSNVSHDLSMVRLASAMAFIFCLAYFATGFMMFRGADEESATLIRLGAFCLFIVVIFRYILMGFALMLVDRLPEADFLYVYGTPVIPIIFTTILYLVYLSVLFCYHNELKHISSLGGGISSNGGAGRSSRRGSGRLRIDSPINFHSPRHLRQTHPGSENTVIP